MKKSPNKLEIKKLFKEFGYLKADEEYKNDLIQAISPEFREAIKEYLKNRPDINTLFGFPTSNTSSEPIIEQENNTEIEPIKMISDYEFNESGENGLIVFSGDPIANIKIEKNISHPKDEKIKKLYRQIATKTHPDKIKLKFLNDLYIKAKNYYQSKDLFSIYLICNDLDVEYNLDDDEVDDFTQKIKALRKANDYAEQTYLWKWYFESDENMKIQILNHFIINNPNHVRPILGPR